MQFTQVPLPSLLQLTRPPCTPTCSLSCSYPQAQSSTNESIVNVGSWSFLMSGQHCSAPCRVPLILFASAEPQPAWKMPRLCSSRWAPCCWSCCFRPPWKCVVGALTAQCQDLTTESNLLVRGCGRHLDLGIKWYWGGDSTKKGACKREIHFRDMANSIKGRNRPLGRSKRWAKEGGSNFKGDGSGP